MASVSADGRFDVMAPACPTRQVLERVSGKWSLLVVQALEAGSLRFSELRARLPGVSQKMMTQTLRLLERDGIVSRTVTPTVPVRTDYQLTATGESLLDVVRMLRLWAYDHMDAIAEARERYDARSCDPG